MIYSVMYDDHCPSQNKYRHAYDMSRGTPPSISTDTPEMIRIRKAQEQLSEVFSILLILIKTMLCVLSHLIMGKFQVVQPAMSIWGEVPCT